MLKVEFFQTSPFHTSAIVMRPGFFALLVLMLLATLIQSPTPLLAQTTGWTKSRIREILKPPTAKEIESVRDQISKRVRKTDEIRLVESGKLDRNGQKFDVFVYRHSVNKHKHYTAIFVPSKAKPGTLPVLIETRGVRYDYPARNISKGPFMMSMLGEMANQFVIVEPCLRGHQLQAVKTMFKADGDRRDSWDGAAEDAMAAVTVALQKIEAANKDLIFTCGLSRGGGVALLHGQRDRRVKGVVAMSAPVDWFKLMARPDDDWADRIANAAAEFDGPANDRAAQFFDWFLHQRERMPNRQIRQRLIASSPMYFASKLPPTLIHHGTTDRSVPSVNAATMNDLFVRLGFERAKYRVIFHEGSGHMLRNSPAAKQTREFLKSMIEK